MAVSMCLALSMICCLLEERTSSILVTEIFEMHGPTRSMVSSAAARIEVSIVVQA